MLKRLPVVILALLILGTVIFTRPALTLLARRQLEQAFRGSNVYVGTCRFVPFQQIAFFDIKIKKEQSYDFKIKQVRFSFNLLSLLGREGHQLSLEEAFLGPVTLKELVISDIRMHLEAGQVRASGDLSIPEIKYDKARITLIRGKLKVANKILYLDDLTAHIFNGEASGRISITSDKEGGYEAVLNFSNLDIQQFIQDFDLKDRFQMTGSLKGEVSLAGKGAALAVVDGDLLTYQPGGKLTITDKRFLENLARTSQQPLDIIVESFKNYDYNIGIVKLGMEQGNLVVDVRLEGEAGQRNLSIVVHDFKLGRI